MITPMTPDTPVATALPDLRAVRLDQMPALSPGTLDRVVQRVLPDRGTETVAVGTAFASSI